MDTPLIARIESLLLFANKPMASKAMAKALSVPMEDIVHALDALKLRYENPESGIRLLAHEGTYQLVTAPEHAPLVEQFFHAELSGELTKPALETLTIIAYRGPISKPELELIRGVNCSLILRNLAMRGLVQQQAGAMGEDDLSAQYTVSTEFLQFLGMTSVGELPEYASLHAHELIDELLKQRTAN